jgi:hypothetical protein
VIRNPDGATVPHTQYYISSTNTDTEASLVIPSIRFQYLTEEERRRMGVCVRYSDHLGSIHESPAVSMTFLEEERDAEEAKQTMGFWSTVLFVCLTVGLSLLIIILFVGVYFFHRLIPAINNLEQMILKIQHQVDNDIEEKVRKEWENIGEFKIKHNLLLHDRFSFQTSSRPF